MAIPSFSNSPWIRGAPQRQFCAAIRRIRSRQGKFDARSSRTSRATAPASTSAFAMPTIDGGWLDQHQRFPPPGPQPPQKQPKQTVSRAEAPIGTSEDAELVAQRKSLEQVRRSRRVAPADRRAASVLMTARIACRLPTCDADVYDF